MSTHHEAQSLGPTQDRMLGSRCSCSSRNPCIEPDHQLLHAGLAFLSSSSRPNRCHQQTFESVPRKVNGRHYHSLPWERLQIVSKLKCKPSCGTYAVFRVRVLQPSELTRYASGQAAEYAPIDVALIHIPVRHSRGRFPVVDGLIVAVLVPDEHESAAAYARVVHPDDADA